MTVFGKILAIFVFLCSMVVFALCVFIYMTRVNYADVAKKYKYIAESAEAGEKSYKTENDRLTKERDALKVEMQKMANVKPADPADVQVNKLQTEIATKDLQVKSLMTENDRLDKSRLLAEKKTSEFEAIVTAAQLLVTQTLADKNKLKEQLQKEVAANIELQVKANKSSEEKVKFEIEAIALRETNKQLESRGQDLAKELALEKKARLTGNTGTTGTTTLTLNSRNAPTFAVDGKIMDVSTDGLVEISIGSDAGLVKGHTLDAFRLSPRSQYLGMIRLITVEPTRAVGQVVGKPAGTLQKGDNVASKLGGS